MQSGKDRTRRLKVKRSLQLNGVSEAQRKDLRKRRAKDREKAQSKMADWRLGGGRRELAGGRATIYDNSG